MSLEPGVLDANVLAYALNVDAPQHQASRALLEAASDFSVTLYVTSQILCELYSIITNPRRVVMPSSSAEAVSIISDVLDRVHRWSSLRSFQSGWRLGGRKITAASSAQVTTGRGLTVLSTCSVTSSFLACDNSHRV